MQNCVFCLQTQSLHYMSIVDRYILPCANCVQKLAHNTPFDFLLLLATIFLFEFEFEAKTFNYNIEVEATARKFFHFISFHVLFFRLRLFGDSLCTRCLIKITCKLACSLFYIPLFAAENKETSCRIPLHSLSACTLGL